MKAKTAIKIFLLIALITATGAEINILFQTAPDIRIFYSIAVQFVSVAFLFLLYIQDLTQKLHNNSEKWKRLVNNLPCCVVLLDKNGRISYWNKKAEEIFGWKAEEVIGRDISFLFPPSSSAAIAEICSIYSKGIKKCETDMASKYGKLKRVELMDISLPETNGESKILIIRDLLEASAIEGKLMQSEKLACIGHLAAGVAHEISNPLSSIQSLVQLTQRKTQEPETQENLRKIREHINRIAGIVRGLVDFSRPTTGKTTTVAINEIISSTVGLLKYDNRCEKLKFKLNLDENLPEIKGVPDHIHQVIMNLLLNSIDACQTTGNTIEVKTYKDGKFVVIEVIDNGEGIKPEIIDRIFEPFFTTKEVGHGTGLGLSVSHGIIASMGGYIKVESTPGIKTKFTVSIPIEKPGGK